MENSTEKETKNNSPDQTEDAGKETSEYFNKEKQKPNKLVFIITGIIVLLFIVLATKAFMSVQSNNPQQTPTLLQATPNGIPNEKGEIILSWGKLNYEPQVIQAQAGKPLRIIGDMKRLTGCYRSLQINELGVSKYFKEGDSVLEFTPTQKGNFPFSCSMGMGSGILVVV